MALPERTWSVRPRALGTAALVAAVSLAGCGGKHRSSGRRSGAEPAVAPVVVTKPAGHRISVGSGPEGIVADARSGLVAVAVRDPAALVLFDARSGRLEQRVSVSDAPRHLQLAGPGGPVLAGEERVNDLLEVTLPGGRYRSVTVGVHPHDATADHGRVFVSDEFGRGVSVVHRTRAVREIGGFIQPGGIVAVGPYVAVVDVGGDSVTLIDSRTLHVIGRLGAGAGPTHAAAGTGGRLYVIDTRGDAVLTYAARPRFRRLARFPLAGTPYGVAIDPRRGRLWVTLTAKNRLVELATGGSALRVLGAYATGRQPNTVAVDTRDGRVFVADAGAGSVQVIDPGH